MIWELRDLVEELIANYGVDRTLTRLLGEQDTKAEEECGLARLHQDWRADAEFDDSTSAALLDIFTTLAFEYMLSEPPGKNIEKCLCIAQEHATRLLTQNDRFAKSRPYLKWIMVKLMSQDFEERIQWKNVVFRGLDRGSMHGCSKGFFGSSLPIYAPVNDEAAEWGPRLHKSSGEAVQVVRMVQQAAMDTGDVQMQAACLQELMWHLAEGHEAVLGELHQLWSDSGQQLEIRDMHLFRFMLAHTPAAREKLRQEILTAGEYPDHGIFQHTRYMILRALATRPHEKEMYLKRAQELLSRKKVVTVEKAEYGTKPSGRDGPRRRSNQKTNDQSPRAGIMRRPQSGSRESNDRAPARASFEEEVERRSPPDKNTTIAEYTRGRSEVSRYDRLLRIRAQKDDVRRAMEIVRQDDEAVARLKGRLDELSREDRMLMLELQGGTSRRGDAEPASDDGGQNDEGKREDGRFARVDDYEGSSEHDDAVDLHEVNGAVDARGVDGEFGRPSLFSLIYKPLNLTSFTSCCVWTELTYPAPSTRTYPVAGSAADRVGSEGG